jgi:hypothetical protein
MVPRAEPKAEEVAKVPTMYTTVYTTEEAVQMHKARNAEVKASSPYEILEDLKAGNARFWTGRSEKPDMALVARSALIDGQAPKVMVLGCADSRVPIEIVFDQGLGARNYASRPRTRVLPRASRPRLALLMQSFRPFDPVAPDSQATSSSAATPATSGAPRSAAPPSMPSTTSASS